MWIPHSLQAFRSNQETWPSEPRHLIRLLPPHPDHISPNLVQKTWEPVSKALLKSMQTATALPSVTNPVITPWWVRNSLFWINIIWLETYFINKLEWGKWRQKNLMQLYFISLVFGNDCGRTHSPTQIPESWGLSLCSLVCTAKTPVPSTNTVFPESENANCVIQALSLSHLHKYEACEGLSGVWESIKLFLSKKVIAF